jgi:hypothetical protein
MRKLKDKMGYVIEAAMRSCHHRPSRRRTAMPTHITKMFIDHPASVGETYFGHMAFAAWFSSRLFMAAFAAVIHAFLPFLFETTASRIIRELYERTHNRSGHAVPDDRTMIGDRA